MKGWLILLFLVLVIPFSMAHQPEIIESGEYLVSEPEISQAFYAELDGEPEFYLINSEEDFRLYVGILVPDIEGATTDYVFEIFKEEELIYVSSGEWEPYYEEHAGDDYFWGPEFGEGEHKGTLVESGNYTVRVSSPDNLGKYVIAIGDIESFPLSEIMETVFKVPRVKSYFGKPWYSAFETPTMLGFLAVSLLVLVVLILAVIYAFKLTKKKEVKK